ncbi:MAG: hypothetical protein QXP81_06290 [Nitrososphaerota archaeon]
MSKPVRILPSIPPSALADVMPCVITVQPMSAEELSKVEEAICYIRHPPTVQLLGSIIPRLQPGGQEAKIQDGEAFIVVSLRSRTATSGQDVEVQSLSDLIVAKCTVKRIK